MKLFICIGFLLATLYLTGCASSGVAPPPHYADGWAYDALVVENLPPTLKAALPGDLCPRGAAPEIFWPALLHATAIKESGLDPNNKYTEPFPGNDGKPQVSQGLFQLSLDDAHRSPPIPPCSGLTAATILEPVTNTKCALGIMGELAKEHKRSSLRADLGRYWSTIRDGKVDASLKALLPQCFEKADFSEMSDQGDK